MTMDSLNTDMKNKAAVSPENDSQKADGKVEEQDTSVFPIVADEWCANCHKEPGGGKGDVCILKKCSACKLVKYCSVACQRNHFKCHEAECLAIKEAREEGMFDKPPQPDEPCNICFLPMSFDAPEDTFYYPCCGKRICCGCSLANKQVTDEANKKILEKAIRDRNRNPVFRKPTCAYCRAPSALTDGEANQLVLARIEKHNDPIALVVMGFQYAYGTFGVPFDGKKAKEFMTRAANLGDRHAHYTLGRWYEGNVGILRRDVEKARMHYKNAAKGGHGKAHHYLSGINGFGRRYYLLAAKHAEMAAALGREKSLAHLRDLAIKLNVIPVSTYRRAIASYQKYQNEISSDHRDAWMKSDYRKTSVTRKRGKNPPATTVYSNSLKRGY